MDAFLKTFGRLKGAVIGMVHLRALPGTPRNTQKLDEIIKIACTEAKTYEKEKVDGIIIENMHDRPWQLPSQMGPETVANMAVVARAVRQHCPSMPIGIQVLSAANRHALAVAAAAECQFIRAEGFVYSHVGDEGMIESCAADLIRYRRSLGAEHIHIFTDIKKKHSSHAITSDVTIQETAQAAELFLSDGVIVTGSATGQAASPQELKDVIGAVSSSLPVIVGSGVTTDNVAQFMSAAALIVGSHLKTHGRWTERLDPTRLNYFMKKVVRLRERDEEGATAADDLDLEEGTDMDEEARLRARIAKQGE